MTPRNTVAGIFVVGIVAAVLVIGLRQGEQEPTPVTGGEPILGNPSEGTAAIADTLRSGEALYTSLVGHDIDPPAVVRALEALGDSVDLRSCKPGDSYTAEVDTSGSLAELVYRRGLTELYVVTRDSAGYHVRRDSIPLVAVTRRIEAELRTSLWETLLVLGEDPRVALALADVLGWEIDFVTDPRVGDTFTIIFEELHCQDRKIGIGDVIGARYVNQGREHVGIGLADENGRMQHYDPEGNSVKRVFLKSPLNYRRISSYFTHRRFHPILKVYRPHLGVDYAAPTGTPVVTIGDGRVTHAGWNGGMGRYIEVRHNSIYSSCYGHLSRYGRGIRKGARVSQGQVIGYVGSSGLSTGPHLDFRVKKHGSYVNPLAIEYPRCEPVAEVQRDEFLARRDVVLRGLCPSRVANAVPSD
jgi:hypothetical protein